MDDVHCLDSSNSTSPMRDENINISDVIEVIETDPDFKKSPQATMYGGAANNSPINPAQIRRQAAIRIVEQPASKALRFRYECEGRSAGSIPGASSTAENKTYPSIQIVGYKGKAVVVVSCVTKDKPYRPHPHNLVGREGCRRGVCTLEIPPDTMSITFSNLGIQCVKKKDIEAHLRVREEIRVDPFKTGFSHRTQPTTIDLNAVRLCFQVFIEGNTPGKFTVPLDPVVSDPIYDKKAMCDLVIVKLSDCVSPVDGGRKDIILLCEKVAKEDIQVRFYEEKDGVVVWEGFGDFQPSQVHKQTAIWFKTPRYMKLDITEPVRVNIQLRRPSDGATSEPLPFELLPLDSGRPSFWSIRRNFAKKGNYSIFNTLLANDAELLRKRQLEELPALNVQNDSVGNEVRQVTDTQGELPAYGEIKKSKLSETNNNVEEHINEIIDDVVEIDQIYSETQKRLEEIEQMETQIVVNQESFDDAKTYSSLQMAFKNPVQIIDIDISDKYEDVIVNPTCPVIDLGVKHDDEVEVEKLPPLPPKRARKVIETEICDVPLSGSNRSLNRAVENVNAIALTGEQAENLLCNTGSTPISLSRSHSFNLQRPRSQNDLAPSKKLPPKPTSTLPNPKKRGFFSKLFGKKEKSASPSKRSSLNSANSLQVTSVSLNRTPSNRSTASIRIPLKGSLTDINNELNNLNQLNDLNQSSINNNISLNNINGNITELLENDDLNMNLDLTEAEHYALYTAMAPHATQSEFDEMSAYYAPVEGGKLLTEAEVMLKLPNNKT